MRIKYVSDNVTDSNSFFFSNGHMLEKANQLSFFLNQLVSKIAPNHGVTNKVHGCSSHPALPFNFFLFFDAGLVFLIL